MSKIGIYLAWSPRGGTDVKNWYLPGLECKRSTDVKNWYLPGLESKRSTDVKNWYLPGLESKISTHLQNWYLPSEDCFSLEPKRSTHVQYILYLARSVLAWSPRGAHMSNIQYVVPGKVCFSLESKTSTHIKCLVHFTTALTSTGVHIHSHPYLQNLQR
jgi:hypothetical protein